jgi:hypothetical protein
MLKAWAGVTVTVGEGDRVESLLSSQLAPFKDVLLRADKMGLL